MNPLLQDLLEHLELEPLEVNLFRGTSKDIGSPQVFGGQVLGQALRAASLTVEDRIVHSLHAYFLRAGDFNAPIVYQVDRSRDGRSFSSRRVVAIQHGRQIFTLAASFQLPEEGIDHQATMPEVPAPDTLPDATSYSEPLLDKFPEKLRRFYQLKRAFDFRPVQAPEFFTASKRPARKQVWFRALDRLPDADICHRCLLAYVSDYDLLATATLPHGIAFGSGNVQMASLDHAMWFHRSFRVDEWLLYDCDSPSAAGARGLARGTIYDQNGRLVASTAQEGLIRLWPVRD
ncbi:MAG: acyl-CoA thioesterase II [Chromatiales bacterium]|nr:acyl-CoA thioesterase II [Chromatiales bacterium]MDH3945482.1 acyl-CoA thioesterase II [Chromatiales bacterium]MDH4014124.1 acyl-CoA thioesterase II [Chromatiales bacterium]PLX55079.1 MAG: acyl-CoA thioesterase II [Chromatiales bacterium]